MFSSQLVKQFIRFAIVGGIGFAADAGLLAFLIYCEGWGKIEARLLSFFVAVTLTWIFNRLFTFTPKHKSLAKEYFFYFFASSMGALVNLGIYIALVLEGCGFLKEPLVALVVATCFSMFFNFIALSRYVYGS